MVVKKKKVQPLAAQRQASKPNPFEIKKSKSNFETVGRRVKGSTKNVIKAKQEAVNRRKKTLLVEYKQLRKANSFTDRRFGEGDDTLTEADKSLARFQRQRVKQIHKKPKSGKFALGDDDNAEDGLTHLGKSLADIADLNEVPDLDEMDEEFVWEMERELNFGGSEGSLGPDGKPKTKKQIMEEIIAKSKAYKAMKAKQREEDQAAAEKLDEDFKQLLGSRGLADLLKPPGWSKENKLKADNDADRNYDAAAHELAFELKGAAGDRTLHPDELAERERQRLEQLEKERMKRMRGEGGDDDDNDDVEGGGAAGASGGFAARRQKRKTLQSGDALDDDYLLDDSDEGQEAESEDEDEGAAAGPRAAGGSDADEDAELAGLSLLDRRHMERAAGDHPLQQGFRQQAAQLLKKYGLKASNPFLKEDGEPGDGGEEEGEDEDEDMGEGEDDESDEDAGALMSKGEEDSESSKGEDGDGDNDDSQGDGEDDADDADDRELQALHEDRTHPKEPPSTSQGAQQHQQQRPSQRSAQQHQQQQLEGPLDLPFTIPVPDSYDRFAALVAGRPAEQLTLVVQRIRAFNATELASDSKKKLQVFYGILVQHFAFLAGTVPISIAHLDALVPLLLAMTAEVPFYAAIVARTRLKKMHERLASELTRAAGGGTATSDHTKTATTAVSNGGANSSPWPTARVLLQLKLFITLFPASDRRHPVLSAAGLLIGRMLSQCIATSPSEASRGLFLCGLALHMAAPAKRHCPEALAFLTDLFHAFLPASDATADAPIRRVVPGLLNLSAAAAGKASSREDVPLLQVLSLSDGAAKQQAAAAGGLKLSLLVSALGMLRRCAELGSESDSFPELFQGALGVLQALAEACLQLPVKLQELRSEVYEYVRSTSASIVAKRMPLTHNARVKTVVVKEYNPRFEEDYVKGRNYDPDRERAEQKRLKKELARERRGAMRELRKDTVFMAEERERERAQVDAERLANQRKFYAELQALEHDVKSGGQKGMNPHLKTKKKE